jgi:hypothetical protein
MRPALVTNTRGAIVARLRTRPRFARRLVAPCLGRSLSLASSLRPARLQLAGPPVAGRLRRIVFATPLAMLALRRALASVVAQRARATAPSGQAPPGAALGASALPRFGPARARAPLAIGRSVLRAGRRGQLRSAVPLGAAPGWKRLRRGRAFGPLLVPEELQAASKPHSRLNRGFATVLTVKIVQNTCCSP